MLVHAMFGRGGGAPASGGKGAPIGDVVAPSSVRSTVSVECDSGALFHSRILASALARFAKISLALSWILIKTDALLPIDIIAKRGVMASASVVYIPPPPSQATAYTVRTPALCRRTSVESSGRTIFSGVGDAVGGGVFMTV